MTKPNFNECAMRVCTSAFVGPDGLSNRDRLAFVCSTFGVDSVALADVFDYDAVIARGDLLFLQAASFLAMLQHEYITRCCIDGLTTEDEHALAMATIVLARAKISWAMLHVSTGHKPPPYPFIN